jgi:hypothetical protein
MSILFVETYLVAPENEAKVLDFHRRLRALFEAHPEKFNGAKAWHVYRQAIGVTWRFIELIEFESLVDLDAYFAGFSTDEELTAVVQEFYRLIDAASHTTEIWQPAL